MGTRPISHQPLEAEKTKTLVPSAKGNSMAPHILDLLYRHVSISRDPHVILGLNINDGQHGMARVLLEHLIDLHCKYEQTAQLWASENQTQQASTSLEYTGLLQAGNQETQMACDSLDCLLSTFLCVGGGKLTV